MTIPGPGGANGRARMSASLPMYARPAPLEAANEALLDALFARLGLARVRHGEASLEAQWRRPDLLLSQTCGYPLVERLRDGVRLIGRPAYRLPERGGDGPPPGWHRSLVIAGLADPRREPAAFRGAVVAVNGLDSNTGMNLLRHWIAPHAGGGRFFSRRLISGSHRRSMALVARGEAALAAIDEVTWEYHRRFEPLALEGLRVLGVTTVAPTLPLIGAASLGPGRAAEVRETLNAILADSPAIADVLGFDEVLPAGLDEYRLLQDYRREAERRGFAVLS